MTLTNKSARLRDSIRRPIIPAVKSVLNGIGEEIGEQVLSSEEATKINERYERLDWETRQKPYLIWYDHIKKDKIAWDIEDYVRSLSPFLIQEEIERVAESKARTKRNKRENWRDVPKSRLQIAINKYNRLLKEAFKPETLHGEKRFKRILERTRNLRDLFYGMPDVLCGSSHVAERIFECQQKLESEDWKTQKRFSMLVSNFLSYSPTAKHHLNVFAERQEVYEQHLQSVYFALRNASLSKIPLDSNKQLAEALRSIPAYLHTAINLPSFNSGRIMQTTKSIALLINYATGLFGDSDGIKNITYELTSRFEGLEARLCELKSQKPEMNGRKNLGQFVNLRQYPSNNGANPLQYKKNGNAKVVFDSSLSPIATFRARL